MTLTGCTGKVAVDDPTPDATAAGVCAAVMADLPTTVLDGIRRDVGDAVYSAAWGKPAIVLRCGVPQPPGLTDASACLEVDGVGWYDEPAENGKLFTTIGRDVFVELVVPEDYAPESGALVDVAATVAAHDPQRLPCS